MAGAASTGGLTFTAAHRGGTGSPLLLLHGFMDTWRTWELVLPALERRHEVLAPTLPGHAGGPALGAGANTAAVLDQLERTLDAVGWEIANLAGNSLGGYLALRLAARGRARTVVALAPAGGWAVDDQSWRETLALQARMVEQARQSAPHGGAALSTDSGRRAATRYTTVSYRHIPAGLLAHQLVGIAAAPGVPALLENALREGWDVAPERIECPVRFVWGTEDRLLPWPRAAARYRAGMPQADWVVLDGVGHMPQLDVPAETSDLILGFTA